MQKISVIIGFTALSLFLLTSCKMSENAVVGKGIDSALGKRDAVEQRLSTAAAEAIASGKTTEAVHMYENLYKHDSDNADVALNYAQLLRKTGNPTKAASVLAPFIADKKDKKKDAAIIAPVILNEYAAIQIDLDNLDRAEQILNRVLEDEKAAGFHADAFNLMGIILDSRGEHKEAEQMFRQSIEGWKGNPTSVMNNLALCLASQGMFDDSLSTLRRALVMSPDKQEIARNIQIVSDLRETVVPAAPLNIKNDKKKK